MAAADPGARTARAAGSSHIYGLDLVRSVAAIGVAVFHLSWQFPPLAGIPPVGWIGVEIFFVLSGLVIASSTAKATAATFIERRFMRLYPAAWACTILAILSALAFHQSSEAIGITNPLGPDKIVASFTLVGGAFVASAFWTLPIELTFYGLVLILLVFNKADKLETAAKGLILWSAAYVVAYAAWKSGAVALPWLELDYGKRNMTLLRHGQYFGMGMLLWICLSQDGAIRRCLPWLGLATLGALVEIVCRSQEIVMRASYPASFALVAALACGTWVAFCALMVVSCRHPSGLNTSPSIRKLIRTLGLISYPFYLLHESIGGNVMGALVIAGVPATPALAGGLLATFLAGLVVVSIWEPAVKLMLRQCFYRLRYSV